MKRPINSWNGYNKTVCTTLAKKEGFMQRLGASANKVLFQPKNVVKQPRYAGTNVAEYAICLAFVLGACIIPFQSSSTGFKSLLGQVFPGPSNGSSVLPSTGTPVNGNPSQGGGGVNPPFQGGGASGNPTGGTVITLENGTTLNLTKIPSISASQLVETAGVAGYTQAYLGALDELIAQLKANPEALGPKAGSIQLLVELSNQGHEIATVQQLIESKASSANNFADLKNQMVTFQDQSRSIGSLAQYIDSLNFDTSLGEIGLTPTTLMNFDVSSNASLSQSITTKFMHTYKSAVNSGVLADSELKQLVDQLAFNVMYMSDTFSNTVHGHRSGVTPSQLQAAAASQISHATSTGICTTGNGIDYGSACQSI
jgi:hypothetical protein